MQAASLTGPNLLLESVLMSGLSPSTQQWPYAAFMA